MKIKTRKRPLLRGIGLALALGSAAGLAGQANAKDVTWEDIANDAQTTENVLGYGIGPKAQRYSPMTTINRDDVERLVPAWSFSFGDHEAGYTMTGAPSWPVITWPTWIMLR